MTRDPGLQPGDEIKCPNCGTWHRIDHAKGVNKEMPEAVQAMLYFFCRGALYFAGAVGFDGKLKRRRPPTS